MFVLTLLADTIRVPPHLLSVPTLTAVTSIIEGRYPNRIVVDVGLVVCPYGPPLEVGDGVLAPGDGGSHHQCVFRCLVFRPFVEEVLVGVVTASHEGGVTVSVGGFFDHVFIPAYWMLNPSRYDEGVGLWVWTPNYEDDVKEEEGEEEEEEEDGGGGRGENGSVKREEGEDDVDGGGDDDDGAADGWIEEDEEGGTAADEAEAAEGEGTTANRFEILIGSAIRFKVKAVNFTRITTTMKGVQATTTTTTSTTATAHASASSDRAFGLNGSGPSPDDGKDGGSDPDGGGGDGGGAAVRRRSSSADLSDAASRPAPMQIVGSICEDGLGLISWWDSPGEESGEHDEDGADAVDYGDDDGGWDANGVKMEEGEDWMKVEEEN